MKGEVLFRRWTLLPVAAGAMLVAGRLGIPAGAVVPLAYDTPALPERPDSLTPLADAGEMLPGCADTCLRAVYVWTPRMPLSRAGISHVVGASERLGVPLTLVAYEEVHAYAAGGDGGVMPLADQLLAAGALTHAPSLVLLEGTEALGPAILGYKSEAAYQALIEGRLAGAGSLESPASAAPSQRPAPLFAAAVEASSAGIPPSRDLVDYEVVGVPGAYFRWVPGRDAIAYESGRRVYLLDLATGENRPAPGYIDFVPTPDGRYFVTPGDGDGGLEFYDAEQVFEVVASGRLADVEPIFTDLRMRDQYPSVGILERSGSRTLYRVLTSWFSAVVYRDYDVRVDGPTGLSSVQPVGEPVRPCGGMALSTPIMSQDGREVAARDEATGTTKIYRILENGSCEILVDFGVATSKVAWHASGRRVAFSIPRRGRGTDAGEFGIFVFDRDARSLARITGSEVASRLAFPDFVDEGAVVYLVPGATVREPSYFRVVDVPR
jgi:hypothetical protein